MQVIYPFTLNLFEVDVFGIFAMAAWSQLFSPIMENKNWSIDALTIP
jgi:hypothetical protein